VRRHHWMPPPSDFRITSDPALSDQIRSLVNRISLSRDPIDRTLDTPFMEAHFPPEQLQAMRERWYAQTEAPTDGDRPA